MNRVFPPLCILCLCVIFGGCGKAEYEGDQRFPLSGKVTCDGQPVDWGAITFVPMGGGKQRVSGGIIENGTYSVPEEKGANAGMYRVEIHWGKLTGKQIKAQDSEDMVDERVEGLPAKYNKNSELTVEVAAPNHRYDFDLTSK